MQGHAPLELTLTSLSFSFYVNPYAFFFLLMIFQPAAFPRNKLTPDLEKWWKCFGGNSPSKVNVYYKPPPILLEMKIISGMSD